MPPLLLYFLLNFLGFFAFYGVWLCLAKPEAYDYTTIPGLKCPELPLSRKSIVLAPGVPIGEMSTELGSLREIWEHSNVGDFFEWLHSTFGPVASFHWGLRYVVSVGTVELAKSLMSSAKSMKKINPLAYGDVLYGNPQFWDESTKPPFNSDTETMKSFSRRQSNLFLKWDPNAENTFSQWAGAVPNQYSEGPVVVVFDKEVELNAHPVPALVPILISVPNAAQNLQWMFSHYFGKE